MSDDDQKYLETVKPARKLRNAPLKKVYEPLSEEQENDFLSKLEDGFPSRKAASVPDIDYDRIRFHRRKHKDFGIRWETLVAEQFEGGSRKEPSPRGTWPSRSMTPSSWIPSSRGSNPAIWRIKTSSPSSTASSDSCPPTTSSPGA